MHEARSNLKNKYRQINNYNKSVFPVLEKRYKLSALKGFLHSEVSFIKFL